MHQHLRPATERELGRMLAELAATRTPVAVIGNGSRLAMGRAVAASAIISTSSLRGVLLYEPTELVMAALSGTPLSRIEAELAAKGQMLPFEPVDMGPVLGQPPGQGTIGGVMATNTSGSRRIAAGAARDHFLGVKAVGGTGEAFKSGGRVMKNVTGYDLTRALAGSWGTLAVMTEVTFKVVPIPQESSTLLLFGLAGDIAVEALCLAMGSPFEVAGAAHLEAELAKRLWHGPTRSMGAAVTAIRLETFSSSLSYRLGRLAALLKPYGEAHVLDHAGSLALWDELRQLSVLQNAASQLWRISTAPKAGPKVVEAVRRYMPVQAWYDWSGGLVWLETPPTTDAGAADIRRVLASHGGHATLVRATPDVRAVVEVFHPMEPAIAAINKQIKSVFDPAGILNPGRMYADI